MQKWTGSLPKEIRMAAKSKKTHKQKRYKETVEAYKKLSPEQIRENVTDALDNPYTKDISKDETRILYTGEFFVQMKKYLEEGKTDLEAYEACGYDPQKLGGARAHKAARQAIEFEKDSRKYDWRSYSGTETPDPAQVTDPKILAAQLQARVKVLETINEVQKKILPEFLESITASNQKR